MWLQLSQICFLSQNKRDVLLLTGILAGIFQFLGMNQEYAGDPSSVLKSMVI